jgi:RND family efflux transporter MFP subunit
MNYESSFSEDKLITLPERPAGQDGATSRWLIIGAALLLLALAGLAAWYAFGGGAGDGAAANKEAAEQAPSVSVVIPGQRNVESVIAATGTLAAKHEIPVGVVGEGGRVVRVLAKAGDWVRQGQTLVVIDRSVQAQQEAALEASVAASRADLNLSQANLDRAAKLIERGFISKADIDRLTATRDANAARLRVSQASLAEGRARNARLDIVAPVSGYVLERNVEPGATVTQGSGILFRLAQNGEMELQARVSENDLARLSTGSRVEVRPVGVEKSFSGAIWELAPTIDPASRQGIARVALGFDPALRPGGFASARILSGAATTPVLPESAVLSDEKGSFVYVIGKDNKVVRRSVTTGPVTAAGIAIASGLAGTERVVLRAGGFLNPGELVKPVVQKTP